MTIGASATCVFLSRGAVVAVQERKLVTGKSWKECIFEMSGSNVNKAPIDKVVLEFKQVESVELTGITVAGPSFSEFFIMQGLTGFNVNLLLPFTAYGHSVNLLLYMVVIIFGVSITGWYAMHKKRGALALAGIFILSVYFGLDVREAFEEAAIMKAYVEDYLLADPSGKTYHNRDNLVAFSDFIRKTVQSEKRPVHFAGDETRYAYMRYLLYPMKIEHNEDELGAVNVFSAIRNLRLEENTLYLNDKIFLTGGKGFAFGWRSFLYLDPI